MDRLQGTTATRDTVQRWIAWMFVGTLVLLCVHAGMARWSAMGVERHTELLVEGQDTLTHVARLRTDMAGAEAAQRAYLFTGDAIYLPQVGDRVRDAERHLAEVRERTADTPAAANEVDALAQALAARIAALREGIAVRDARGLDAAIAWIESGKSRAARENVLAETEAVEARLDALVQERARRAEQSRRGASYTLAASTFAVGIALVCMYLLARWEVARRLRAAEALRVSEERLRVVVENLPVILFATDRTGTFTVADGRGLESMDSSPDKLVGRSVFEVCADSPHILDNVRRAMAGESFSAFVPVKNRVFYTSYAPLRDRHGHLDGMLGVSSDVTGQQRAETELRRLTEELERRVAERTAQLEAANRELESFSYSVSHDLRAPLRSIDGFSAALQEESGAALSPSGQAYLERVRAAAKRMAQLIDDLLKLSRVTRTELTREDVDLSAMAHGILEELAKGAPERQVKVEVQEGLAANCDPRLVRIALENLLGNAWKFTAKKPEASIRFHRVDTPEGPAFQVADNGAGFDMAYASRLFGPFQRLHSPQEFEGTGIGLATVQRIVNRHGGKVWAEAVPDQGARFTFTLEP